MWMIFYWQLESMMKPVFGRRSNSTSSKFGEPAIPISKFLGGHHKVLIEGGVSILTTQIIYFLLDAAEKFRIEAGVERLAKVRMPYLDEDGLHRKGH